MPIPTPATDLDALRQRAVDAALEAEEKEAEARRARRRATARMKAYETAVRDQQRCAS